MTLFTPRRRFLLLAAPSIALTACSNIIGPPPASQIYSLRAPIGHHETGPTVDWSLAIVKPDASESLDTDRIAVASDDTKFDYYANAVWTDHLPDLIQTRLLSAFEATHRIGVVARDEDGIHAEYKLLTDIRDFEARYGTSTTASPTVAVTLVAHAVNAHSRKIVSSVTVASSQACATNSVNSVVNAFDVALAEVTTQIVDWALNLPAPESLQISG